MVRSDKTRDMLELPFIDDYFDGVICTNVLHHGKLVQIKQATREVHRVMKGGASAFVVAPSTEDFRRGNGGKLEPSTYVFTEGDERGIIPSLLPAPRTTVVFQRVRGCIL